MNRTVLSRSRSLYSYAYFAVVQSTFKTAPHSLLKLIWTVFFTSVAAAKFSAVGSIVLAHQFLIILPYKKYNFKK